MPHLGGGICTWSPVNATGRQTQESWPQPESSEVGHTQISPDWAAVGRRTWSCHFLSAEDHDFGASGGCPRFSCTALIFLFPFLGEEGGHWSLFSDENQWERLSIVESLVNVLFFESSFRIPFHLKGEWVPLQKQQQQLKNLKICRWTSMEELTVKGPLPVFKSTCRERGLLGLSQPLHFYIFYSLIISFHLSSHFLFLFLFILPHPGCFTLI